jgi:hypothetical protein
MRKETRDTDRAGDAETPGTAGRGARKPYSTPRLVTHGDLRKLALGTGGRRGDGKGAPSSKE